MAAEVKKEIELETSLEEGRAKVLQRQLTTPYNADGSPITPALLHLDPTWDNLRGDPRFQKLLARVMGQAP